MIKMLIVVASMIVIWQISSSIDFLAQYKDYILAGLMSTLLLPWITRQVGH